MLPLYEGAGHQDPRCTTALPWHNGVQHIAACCHPVIWSCTSSLTLPMLHFNVHLWTFPTKAVYLSSADKYVE